MADEKESLLDYKKLTQGNLKLSEEDLSMFEKVTWKLFVFSMSNKILIKEKEKVAGKESIIQFFPLERKKIIEKKNKKITLMKDLSKPLFYITYDKRQCPELIDKSGEKIPEELFYVILCR